MKKITFLLLLLSCNNSAFSQLSPREQQKIAKIAGTGLIQQAPQVSYPYSTGGKNVVFQPSATQKHDTTGLYANNEYLLFRSALHFKNGTEVSKLISPDYVSVSDYREFQNAVRDSIARRKIDDRNEGASVPLNRSKPFSYKNPDYAPYLVDMYLTQYERFYKVKLFDSRKLNYVYDETYESLANISGDSLFRIFPALKAHEIPPRHSFQFSINTQADQYAWAETSAWNRDTRSVLAQLYMVPGIFDTIPITGLTGAQAKAYCHWKQAELQRKFRENDLNYTVIVTLPTYEEQQSLHAPEPHLVIPQKIYTQLWKISPKEYDAFLTEVRDSVLMEHLYNESAGNEALSILQHPGTYFNEAKLKWIEPDTAQKYDNRFYFPLKSSSDLTGALKKRAQEFRETDQWKNPSYRFYDLDARNRGTQGIYRIEPNQLSNDRPDTVSLYVLETGEDGEYVGKDMSIDSWNFLDHSSGVRGHANLRRFIYETTVPILPAAGSTFLSTISYEQAIAFYHWKYRIYSATSADDWQQYVLPTAEQYRAIQTGQAVIAQPQTISYPTPLFRYVVHLYPGTKNAE